MADDDFMAFDPMGSFTGGSAPDPVPPPAPPIEEDRATRARNMEGNFFAQHVTGTEPTYEDHGILARARDVAAASFFHTLIGSAEANMEAHPATTVQEAVGIDPRAKADPDEVAWFQRQQLVQAYQDYARSRLNERNVAVTPAQMAQLRSDLYPDANSPGTYAADVLGTLAGGAASPETLYAPEVKVAEVAGLAGRSIVSRMIDSGTGAAVANAVVDPVAQALGTSAGLQHEYDPMQSITAPAIGFAGGALIHGAGEVVGRGAASVVRGFRAQRAAQAVTDLAADTPAFRPTTGDDRPATTPPQPAGETSAQVEQAAAAPAPDVNAPVPSPVEQPAAVYDRASILAKYGNADGSIDLGQASAALGREVQAALDAGKSVTYHIEDRAIPIVGTRDGRPVDAQGQAWGVQPLLQPLPGNHDRIEIGGPGEAAQPQVASDGASGQPAAEAQPAAMPAAGGRPEGGVVEGAPGEGSGQSSPVQSAGGTAITAAANVEAHALRGDLVPGMQPHRVATPDGRGVEVAPIVVEARDLRTSADAGYDPSLQPRDRDRAASQAQIRDIAGNLDPERLGFSAEADRGAPIVGNDGTVESGNGRVLAVRQAYEQGGEAAQRYKDWLAGQGVDVSRYDQPVLVRQRLTDLSPEERQAFTVSANQASTLSMSASERALADSHIVTPTRLDLLRNADDLGAAANAEFRRAFVGALPASERGALTAADGSISAEGLTRIRNAVLAAAYGDSPVLARIAEATHDEVRSISAALTAAAPEWARLKADIASGRVPTDFDLRADLLEAVQRTADLRAKGTKLADHLAQLDAFDRMSSRVEQFMRLFADPSGRKAAGAQRITDALRFYAEEARKVSAERGLDLGLTPIRPDDIQGEALAKAHQTARDAAAAAADGREPTLFERGGGRGDGAGGGTGGGEARRPGAGEPGRGAAGQGDSEGARTGRGRTSRAADADRSNLDELSDPRAQPAAQRDILFRGRQAPTHGPAVPALPPAPHTPEIASLQSQAFALADKLDIPLRQGRLASSQAAGQYSRRYGVARIRDVGDFFTVAHEMGHAIEQKVQKDATAFIARNAFELGRLDQDPLRGLPEEGFAEFMATAVTNPAAAKAGNPTLYQEMRQMLAAKAPDILAAMDEASAAYARYLAAPSEQKISAAIVDGERHGWIREAIKEVRENGLPHTIGTWLGQAYTAIVAENYPVMRAVRELTRAIQQEQGGGLVSLPASRDPAKLIRLFASAKNGALTQLRWGVVPYRELQPVGHSMYDALNHAAGGPSVLGRLDHESAADLSTYMVAKRVANLWDRYTAGDLPNPPAAFSRADAVQAMADLLAKNPRLDEAAMMAHAFTRNMLGKQRDAGIITADLHDTLTKDPFYTPLFRDVSDKPLAGKAGGGSSADGPGLTDTVKRLRGSSRDIIDPIQGILMQTLLAERTIRHNDIVRGLADLGERAGFRGAGIVEPVAAKELKGQQFNLRDTIKVVASQRGADPHDTALLMQSVTNAFGDDPIMGSMFKMDIASKRGEPVMFYKEAGELKAVRFAHSDDGLALYETLATLPRAASDLWIRSLATATKTLRLGVVSHPTFVLANYVKDQLDTAIKLRGYFPIISGLKGIWSELKQDEAARLYAYLGGMSAGTATTGIREVERSNVAQLARRGYLQGHASSLDGIVEMTQITEAATRNSVFAKVYAQKLKQGLAPIDAATEAAFQGTDLMDFGQHGSRTLALRALIPFINPHIQGLNKAARTMLVPLYRLARGDVLTADDKERAVNAGLALGKFAALGGVLGAVHAALMWDREEYRDATPEQKAMNFVFPVGKYTVRIPKPYELGLGYTGGEYAFARLMKDDPRAGRQYMEAAWEVLKTPDMLSGNPLIKSFVEGQTGSSLFTGRPIVPEKLQMLDPQFQYNEKTSGIARKASDASAVLAKVMNDLTGSGVDAWSPMMVDNTIGNLGGYLGKEVQINSKILLDQEDGPEQRFEDAAFFKRFTLDPNKWSTTVQDFYQFAGAKTGDFARAANTVQTLNDNGHRQEAADFLAGLSDEKKAFATLATAGNEDGKAVFSADDRRLNPVTRAQAALGQLSALGHELLGNRQTNTETGEHIAMTPAQLRDVGDAVRQLAAMEMRNALVMTGDPGYVGRPLLSVRDQFETIKAIMPDAAEEIARRYATAKVFPTDHVADVWPDARKELLAKGSEADLSDALMSARIDGYEFGGTGTGRRSKVRAVVKGRELEPVD